MSKTNFIILFDNRQEAYRIKVIYRYRRTSGGEVHTACLLFTYSNINSLPNDLNLQTARSAGFAKCVSTDQFSKDIGRKLTLARAMKDAELFKDTRTQVWEQYTDGKYLKEKE